MRGVLRGDYTGVRKMGIARELRRRLACERLEHRCLLSATAWQSDGEFHRTIVAGDPKGKPADSPTQRIDLNTTTSPFAGVGSLRIASGASTYICTGTLISPQHVLTAGHCVDIDDNGQADVSPSDVTFNLNYGGDLTSQIPASSVTTHPDFTGFNSPSVNDDLAIIRLSQPVPAGVPIYPLVSTDMAAGSTRITLVGYGQSGTGTSGYTVNASYIVKRRGENMVDAFYGQDDANGSLANEVFRFDFDGPKPGTNKMGGRSLGNDKETTVGGGDSGGPSFIVSGGNYVLAGVNTFTQGFTAPRFGSLGGGINIYPYLPWISAVTGIATAGTSGAVVSAAPAAGHTSPALDEEFTRAEFVISLALLDDGEPLLRSAIESPTGHARPETSLGDAAVVDLAMQSPRRVLSDNVSTRVTTRRVAPTSRYSLSRSTAGDAKHECDAQFESLSEILSRWEPTW